MRRFILTASIAAIGILGLAAGTATAAPSSCGATHGAFANVNGNFGFLGEPNEAGERGTPGYHNGAVGQDPGATGANSSEWAGVLLVVGEI